MKKVIIRNLAGNQIAGGKMEDPSAWIADCVANNYWGLPERLEIKEDGELTGSILPAEYTIDIQDVSSEIEQEQINNESLQYLASTDWLIIRELDAGTPCPSDVKQARAEARARIVR